jgi:hypothetical protein
VELLTQTSAGHDPTVLSTRVSWNIAYARRGRADRSSCGVCFRVCPSFVSSSLLTLDTTMIDRDGMQIGVQFGKVVVGLIPAHH